MDRRASTFDIWESHLKDSGGDLKEAGHRMGDQITRLVKAKKMVPDQIRMDQLFKAMVESQFRGGLDPTVPSVEIAEAASASAFPYATSQAIFPIAIDAYEVNMGQVGQMVKEVTSKKIKEDHIGFTALGGPTAVPERAAYEETYPGEKRWTIDNTKVGRIVSLTKEMILMDQTGDIVDHAASIGGLLGELRHQWIVERIADIASWDGKTAGANHTYNGSTVAIYANDHTATDGVVNDNLITTAFSSVAIVAMVALLRRMQDEEGNQIVAAPRLLLVPPELEFDALKLVKSKTNFDDANNAFNPHEGAYQVVSSPFLTSTSNFFLGDPIKMFRWQWVWRPMVERQGANSERAFTADIINRWKVSMMGGCGAIDYRFMIRSSN